MRVPVLFSGPVPSCATSKQYEAWRAAASIAKPLCGFCTDCTPDYQSEMKGAGRCENPRVAFVCGDDGEWEGKVDRDFWVTVPMAA